MRYKCLAAAGIAVFVGVSHAKEPVELWRDGYEIVWESGYEEVEECTPDKPVGLSGGYVFVCDGYEYVYHYGVFS